MASKPHSGTSIFADTRCIAIILLNSSVLLVSDKTCLYPKVGRQVKSLVIPLQKNKAEAEKQRFEKNKILRDTKWLCWKFQPIRKNDAVEVSSHVLYCIPAGIGQLFFCDLDEGQGGFLHEWPKAHSKFTGEIGHLFRQRGA